MALPPNERKTLSSLIEKLGENVIDASVDRRGFLVLRSKTTGRILMQCDLDCTFDADGNYFTRDVDY